MEEYSTPTLPSVIINSAAMLLFFGGREGYVYAGRGETSLLTYVLHESVIVYLKILGLPSHHWLMLLLGCLFTAAPGREKDRGVNVLKRKKTVLFLLFFLVSCWLVVML